MPTYTSGRKCIRPNTWISLNKQKIHTYISFGKYANINIYVTNTLYIGLCRRGSELSII